MALAPLILISNVGSVSRRYSLYDGQLSRGHLHIEYHKNKLVGTFMHDSHSQEADIKVLQLADVTKHVLKVFRNHNALESDEKITNIGIRIVAPSSYFLEDRRLDEVTITQLGKLEQRALQIHEVLQEIHNLQTEFAGIPIIGVSDSAFHRAKPDYASNYGLPFADSDKLDIKRFGYHGLSVASAIDSLAASGKLATKIIVCHLGAEASVSAVLNSKSIDTTMGYSPNSGLVMATHSGDLDATAVQVLQDELHLNSDDLQRYVSTKAGLLGLSGQSADIRELLAVADHKPRAQLALDTYIYSIQKGIGQMAAALDGVEALIFTGTVSERSAIIRQHVVAGLTYLGLHLDSDSNLQHNVMMNVHDVSQAKQSKPIIVVRADEARQMVRRIINLLSFTPNT